ncbi:MAG: GHKL domain-containing protein [Oscillospiraceae bacterium]
MLFILSSINYTLILFFGIFVAASFNSINFTKKNVMFLLVLSGLIAVLQIVLTCLFSMKLTEMLYPIISHLPTILVFIFKFKKRVISSVFSIMAAYLCCQISNWFGVLLLDLTENKLISYATRSVVTVIMFFFIIKFMSPSITLVFTKKTKSILIFSILPASYYLFDYITVVYTKLLYSGSQVIFEFLPFVFCIAYFIFNIVYFKEYEEKCEAERHNHIMEIQNKYSVNTIENIKNSEYEISILRHDLRHFLTNILTYIENNNNETAKKYIKEIISSSNKIQLQRFCKNELVNTILSFYDNKMKEENIKFEYSVGIPENLPCSDVDFTSILSNGLENAIQAIKKVEDNKKIIILDLHMNENKLLLSIKNYYIKKPLMKNGLPQTNEAGHGFGTQSINYVTTKLNGNCQFIANNDIFTLRVII